MSTDWIKTPTEAMLKAGCEADIGVFEYIDSEVLRREGKVKTKSSKVRLSPEHVRRIYEAMMAARPK